MKRDRETWVVFGGTGFIGSRVVHQALVQGHRVITAQRKRPDEPGAEFRHLDLPSPADDVRAIVDGADVVIHAASYVGRDPALARSVTVNGTRLIVEATTRAGITRLLSVSTASVVGTGPHRGSRWVADDHHPQSVASATRATAEVLLRDAGGDVLRPHLVYGYGDTWFVPTLARLLQDDPAAAATWTASVSTIHVDDLARLITALAQRPGSSFKGETSFAGAPQPDTMSDIARLVSPLIPPSAGGDRPRPQLSAHQESLLTTDSWFETASVWRNLGLTPAHQFALSDRDTEWYRREIAMSSSARTR